MALRLAPGCLPIELVQPLGDAPKAQGVRGTDLKQITVDNKM